MKRGDEKLVVIQARLIRALFYLTSREVVSQEDFEQAEDEVEASLKAMNNIGVWDHEIPE